MKKVIWLLLFICAAPVQASLTQTGPSSTSSGSDFWAEIYFLNVGQGDGTLIHCPINSAGERKFILFDFGSTKHPKSGIANTVKYVQEIIGTQKISTIIISHGDIDHFNQVGKLVTAGLVSKNVTVYLGGGSDDYISPKSKTPTFKKGGEWLKGIKNKFMVGPVTSYSMDPPVQKYPLTAKAPSDLANLCGAGSYLTFKVIANQVAYTIKEGPYYGKCMTDSNDKCIIDKKISKYDNNTPGLALLLMYRNPASYPHNVWLTGDMTMVTEKDVAANFKIINFDPTWVIMSDGSKKMANSILKVAHHGSNSSTSFNWLDEVVNPAEAIFSSRKRPRWAHPDCEVVDDFDELFEDILKTDDMQCFTPENHSGILVDMSQKHPTNPKIMEDGYSYKLTLGITLELLDYDIKEIPHTGNAIQTEEYECPYYFGPTDAGEESEIDIEVISSPAYCDGNGKDPISK